MSHHKTRTHVWWRAGTAIPTVCLLLIPPACPSAGVLYKALACGIPRGAASVNPPSRCSHYNPINGPLSPEKSPWAELTVGTGRSCTVVPTGHCPQAPTFSCDTLQTNPARYGLLSALACVEARHSDAGG